MAEASRRQQWLRGVLDLCVLATLTQDELHGYAIMQRLETAGVPAVKAGTLYPVLARLQDAGHVTARWEPGDRGPGRKCYTLTSSGTQLLCEQGHAWRVFARTAGALIDGGRSSTP